MFLALEIGLIMGLLWAWVVLALALSFRLLNFPDLTVEGSFLLGAAIFAALLKADVPIIAAIALGILAGGCAGALTGFIHERFKLNKFLCGIIVIAITYSLSLRIMGASNIGLLQTTNIFDAVAPLDKYPGINFHLGTILLLLGLLSLCSLLIVYFLSSRAGLRLRVAGSNPNYARSLGINVPVNTIIGLTITNGLSALAGILVSMHQGFTDISMGQGLLILALAAMTIGERLLPEKNLPFHIFVVLSAILGGLAYQTLVAYAVYLGLAATDLKLVTAVLVLLVVAFRVSRQSDLLEGDEQ